MNFTDTFAVPGIYSSVEGKLQVHSISVYHMTPNLAVRGSDTEFHLPGILLIKGFSRRLYIDLAALKIARKSYGKWDDTQQRVLDHLLLIRKVRSHRAPYTVLFKEPLVDAGSN